MKFIVDEGHESENLFNSDVRLLKHWGNWTEKTRELLWGSQGRLSL